MAEVKVSKPDKLDFKALFGNNYDSLEESILRIGSIKTNEESKE